MAIPWSAASQSRDFVYEIRRVDGSVGFKASIESGKAGV